MSTALKKKEDTTIRSLLEGDNFKLQIARALPKHLTADRFIRVAITAMTRTPKLAECEKASFFNSLLTLSQLGIEPDGRRAHLIPFMNRKRNCYECQLIIDYKGLVELVMNTGNVSNIHADVICENDEFVYDKGEIKAHRIDFRKPRGNPYAAYAVIRFKDGTEKAEIMTHEEIEGIRKRSKAAESGPWVTDWSEMAKKTVFRRATKWVKLSPEQRDIVESDDNQFPYTDNKDAVSTAQMLSERIKASKAIEVSPEPETPQEEAGEAELSRCQGYIDMLLAAQDIKALDTTWSEISEDIKECRFLPSEEENQQLYAAREQKKKELAKKK